MGDKSVHEHDLLSITVVKFYRKRDPSLSGNGQLDFDSRDNPFFSKSGHTQ